MDTHWLERHEEVRDITFADLASSTRRFAHVLDDLGVGRGDRVSVLSGLVPDLDTAVLDTAVLGTLEHGAAVGTTFAAFGPEPIRQRLMIGASEVLVTTQRLYRRKVTAIRSGLPDLAHVILVDAYGADDLPPGTLGLPALLAAADDDGPAAPTRPEDPGCSTSPVAPPVPRRARCTSTTAIVTHVVTERHARDHPAPDLRFVASVGEPLDAEAVRWGLEGFGLPIHDNWRQTETAGIMVANFAAMETRPGSMGRPVPGIDVRVLRRDEHGDVISGADGRPVLVATPTTEGELDVREGWPSIFREHLGQPERYAPCVVGTGTAVASSPCRTPTGTSGSSPAPTT